MKLKYGYLLCIWQSLRFFTYGSVKCMCGEPKLIKKYIENANLDLEKAKKGDFFKQLGSEYKVMTLEDLNKQFDLCVAQILKFFSGLKEE